jgi:hypothetical protein
VTVTLCVLLWANAGEQAALIEYEDTVLRLLPAHEGRVVSRARTAGADGEPLEIHLLQFGSEQAFDDYLNDDARLALTADRDRAIARTEVFRVDLV